jgi:hypothetical protein
MVRRFVVVLAVAASLVGASGPALAATDLNFRFGAPTRTVVDLGPTGTSVGDLTVTTGDVRRTEAGKPIGYYTTNQITVRADAVSGREIRKVDLSISLPDGMIFATSLIRAQTGVPPRQQMTFAVTGGTGAYAGASGTLVHEGVAGKPGFAVTIDLI